MKKIHILFLVCSAVLASYDTLTVGGNYNPDKELSKKTKF
jgi:hypothetical protein